MWSSVNDFNFLRGLLFYFSLLKIFNAICKRCYHQKGNVFEIAIYINFKCAFIKYIYFYFPNGNIFLKCKVVFCKWFYFFWEFYILWHGVICINVRSQKWYKTNSFMRVPQVLQCELRILVANFQSFDFRFYLLILSMSLLWYIMSPYY